MCTEKCTFREIVDLDGNVTVRNASPNIFVDGKPSTLTLDQIPADAMKVLNLLPTPLQNMKLPKACPAYSILY